MRAWLKLLTIACPLSMALVLLAIATALHLGYPEPDWLALYCMRLLFVVGIVTMVSATLTTRYRWGPRRVVDLVLPAWYYYTVPARWIAVGVIGCVLIAFWVVQASLYVAFAGLALIIATIGQMRLRNEADGDTMPWNEPL